MNKRTKQVLGIINIMLKSFGGFNQNIRIKCKILEKIYSLQKREEFDQICYFPGKKKIHPL